jgi:beta-lactamase regulating signal transducer with metallopeptidase domain
MNVTADALSAALMHSLWQNAIVGLLLWSTLAVLRHQSANARYLACCASLAIMTTLPVVTTLVLSARAFPIGSSIPASAVVAPLRGDNTPLLEPTSPVSEVRRVSVMASVKPWTLPVWLAGVLVCSLRLVLASMHTVALRRRSDAADGAIASTVSRLAARIGVGRSVSVRVSMLTDSPATLGFLRPVILLPPAVALGVTPQQLEALLAHELAHIRRHDYLVNVLQMLAETLFFYHPAVWWASRRMRIERELCCDDIAVNACGDAVGYAQALTKVARLMVGRPGMAVGAGGGALPLRIRRLLGVNVAGSPVPPLWVAAASLVMIVALMFTGPSAQSPAPGTLALADAGDTVLRGRVVDARTGEPVAGASVRAQYITGVEHPPTCPIGDCEDVGDRVVGRTPIYRVTATDDGRFNIRGMKPGDYLIAAVAPGYVQRYFGQTSDDMPEMSVHVAAGGHAPSIDVRLEPAGSVSGRVFSDAGEGLPGVEVELMRRAYIPGGARPIAVAFAQTEDMGAFHFRNVTAGEYYVRAYASPSIAPTRGDAALSYAATFFPEATDITFAQPVVVGSGQELAGVDFALSTARTRTVSGRLVDPVGASLVTATVSLLPHSTGSLEVLKAPVAADGRFRFVDVPAADYMLTVFDSADRRSWNTAVRDVSVLDDVTDLVLTAGPSVAIAGRVVRDGDRPLPFNPTDLQISTEQRKSDLGTHSAGFGKVAADGTFSMRSGAGTLSLRIVGLPPRWFSHQQGRYEFDGLPISGYRAVAVTSLPRNAWTDPDVLARLWPSASAVSLDELGQGTLHLRVVPAPTDLIQ